MVDWDFVKIAAERTYLSYGHKCSYIYACTVKLFDVLRVSNALCFVTDFAICCVVNAPCFPMFLYCVARPTSAHNFRMPTGCQILKH